MQRSGSGRPRQPARRLQAWAPVVIGVLAVGVVVAAFLAFTVEAPRSSVLNRLYASVDLFLGAYVAQKGQSGPPSPLLSLVGLSALLLTFTAALTALLAVTSRAREWFRARRAGSELVVIGSGEPAAELIRSYESRDPRGVLLVTGDRRGPAAVAGAGQVAMTVADLEMLALDGDLADLASRRGTVAVATDDDALNVGIAETLSRQPSHAGRKLMAIVGHPLLAEEMRPALIAGTLGMPYGISCPVENIAEQVCHHLDEILVGDPVVGRAGRASVVVEGDDGAWTRTVATWVERFTWSRSFLSDAAEEPVPALRMQEDAAGTEVAPTIRIFVGEDLAETAARTLRRLRTDGGRRSRAITVTNARLMQGARAAGVVVVDARSAAWDQRLVFDDVAEQWGRMFHSVYGLIYGFGGWRPWQEIFADRDGQSSIKAGLHMLAILDSHGFSLVKTEGRPADPGFTAAEVSSMAEAEHEEWLERRTYRDAGGTWLKVSATSKDEQARVPWAELDEVRRRRNEDLVRCTFPAMAALFGYEIRRRPVPDAASGPAEVAVGLSERAG